MSKANANPDVIFPNSGWIIECTNIGSLEEVLSSLRDFTKNLELAAGERPDKRIGIHCRAGQLNLIKVPTLKEVNGRIG